MTTMTPAQPVRRAPGFLVAPFAAQTWRELGYLGLQLLVAPFAFAYVVFVPSFASGVGITVVGLWLVGALIVGARGWGGMYRSLARDLLGADVTGPPWFVRPRGFFRGMGAMLGDVDGWRALLFMLITFPLSIVAWTVSIVFLAVGWGGITYAAWYRFLPEQQAPDGTWHRGALFSTDSAAWFVDTPPRIAALAGVGVVFLWLWPWVQRGLTGLFVTLTRGLLAPSRMSVRVAQLRASRAEAVEDAAVRLRRIERDLHDGTQARLVAVAMQLGEAREQLGPDGDPALAAQLLDSAHASAKETLVELRDIARGIHPPALDAGLAVALETLAARSVIPVTLDVSIDETRPLPPAVGSIAYYTVAELLTNAAKHARASAAQVRVTQREQTLCLRVSDDGRGGARVHEPSADGHRSGLAGLDERVGSVDGTFDLSSPVGGPTVVTVTLPISTEG
ncbi:MAG: sensor domain-containing protein [Micrococcales bacterium]|nr:sensor domain-containing protein [Micrococcales bacterium]